MKKLIPFLIALLFISHSNAQDIRDAYRYSSEELNGTARFMAMSGAFGALGGDISAISLNPASSAVFLSSSASVSLNYRNLKAKTAYFNGRFETDNDDLNLGNLGGVLVFNTSEDNNWRKFAIGLNYSTTQNFEENYFISGNSNNSIDSYFLNYANGIPLELLQLQSGESISDLYSFLGENNGFAAQQAFLGYQAFVIESETNNPNNSEYFSLIAPGNFDQRYNNVATGLNGKFTFNFGTQFKDFLYLGVNLNSHFINYENVTEFSEFNSNPGSETNEVYFDNFLTTNGEGFSAQIGGIAKINDYIRLGLTYDTPTWYNIREEASQYLETFSDEFDEQVIIAPSIINVYPEYRLKTPAKLTGSVALLFGKRGLLNFDYSRKDFSNTEFKPENDLAFQQLNNQISSEMKAASTYKIGGEYRIQNLSLRAGYSYEESPFKDESRFGSKDGYSGGLGYNFGNFNLDLAYNYLRYTENTPLYTVGLTNRASIERNLSNLTLSLNFGL